MAAKTIIFKNAIANTVVIESLGISILQNEMSEIEYEDILYLEDADDLINEINNNNIIVNDGTNDLVASEAIQYLQIGSDLLANYYTKSDVDNLESGINDNIQGVNDNILNNYYTAAEVNQKITEVDGAGIKGAVDYVSDLPTEGNQEGDIYIVRSSIGTGGGPVQFTPDGQTALYLPFDDDWQDILGHDGESHGVVDIVAGKVNNAGDFDGDDDWVEFYSDSDFGQGPNLSVGGWIYPRRTGVYGIIGRWSNSGDGDGWKIDVYGNKLRMSLDTYSWCGLSIKSPSNLPTETWSHVVLVYDGNNLIMYINGVAVNSTIIVGEYIDSQNKSIYVGRYMGCYDDDDDNSSDKYYDGLMDEMFVMNRALSQEEIESLIFTQVDNYDDEGFYKWNGTEWEFLARNTGESGGTISHNNLLNLNSGDYQHLTVEQKNGLVGGLETELHSHSQYYTKTEIDLNKADINHTHDNYQTSAQVDTKIQALTYTNISSNDSSTNVTGAELELLTNGSNADGLHTHEGIGGSGTGGLDEAYDLHSEYSQGQGRNITVDYGPVKLDASNGFAPLRLTEINYTPSQWLGGGEMCYNNGELYIYDATRSKWLTASSLLALFGRNGNDRTGYMKFCGEIVTSSTYGGFVAPWNGTIVGISCNAKNRPTSYFSVGIDGGGWDSFYWGGVSENSWDNINIDFSTNQRITIWQDSNNNKPDYPAYILFIKRRLA